MEGRQHQPMGAPNRACHPFSGPAGHKSDDADRAKRLTQPDIGCRDLCCLGARADPVRISTGRTRGRPGRPLQCGREVAEFPRVAQSEQSPRLPLPGSAERGAHAPTEGCTAVAPRGEDQCWSALGCAEPASRGPRRCATTECATARCHRPDLLAGPDSRRNRRTPRHLRGRCSSSPCTRTLTTQGGPQCMKTGRCGWLPPPWSPALLNLRRSRHTQAGSVGSVSPVALRSPAFRCSPCSL